MPVDFILIISHNFCMANSTIINIQKNIKYFRNLRGLTQEKLGELCGISHDYISEIERGRKVPSLKRLIIIAEQLEVTLDDLSLNNE